MNASALRALPSFRPIPAPSAYRGILPGSRRACSRKPAGSTSSAHVQISQARRKTRRRRSTRPPRSVGRAGLADSIASGALHLAQQHLAGLVGECEPTVAQAGHAAERDRRRAFDAGEAGSVLTGLEGVAFQSHHDHPVAACCEREIAFAVRCLDALEVLADAGEMGKVALFASQTVSPTTRIAYSARRCEMRPLGVPAGAGKAARKVCAQGCERTGLTARRGIKQATAQAAITTAAKPRLW